MAARRDCRWAKNEKSEPWVTKDRVLRLTGLAINTSRSLDRAVGITLLLTSRIGRERSYWSYGFCGLIVLATISPTMAPKETMVLITNANLMQTRQLDIVGVKETEPQRDHSANCDLHVHLDEMMYFR